MKPFRPKYLNYLTGSRGWEKKGRAEFNTQRKKKCQLRGRKGGWALPLVQPSWMGVRMCRSQEEPGRGGPPPAPGLLSLPCLYRLSPSLPCSSLAAAFPGIAAWVSPAKARGKAARPGQWGSLTVSCSKALPPGEESGSRGSGFLDPQGEPGISFPQMPHTWQGSAKRGAARGH